VYLYTVSKQNTLKKGDKAMTDEKQTSSELIDRAISLIKQDIEINKKLSGTDFSHFLGAVLNVVSNLVFQVTMETRWCKKEELQWRITDNEQMRDLFCAIMFRVIEVAQSLEQELGKGKVIFLNTPKAITAIGLILACDCDVELEKIEKSVQELMSGRENEEISHTALKSLLKPL
jgi:hypothetical protein